MKAHSAQPAVAPSKATLYDTDFFAWAQETAALLRARRFGDIDLVHAADEIEDMGKRDLKELNSRMQVLLMHLLKWQLQPDMRWRSWQSSIVTERLEIEALLEQSPSLRPKVASGLGRNYAGAVKRAVAKTGLAKNRFPSQCPFAPDQILNDDFLPE